jgi:hypothetical protein
LSAVSKHLSELHASAGYFERLRAENELLARHNAALELHFATHPTVLTTAQLTAQLTTALSGLPPAVQLSRLQQQLKSSTLELERLRAVTSDTEQQLTLVTPHYSELCTAQQRLAAEVWKSVDAVSAQTRAHQRIIQAQTAAVQQQLNTYVGFVCGLVCFAFVSVCAWMRWLLSFFLFFDDNGVV